MVLIVRVIRCLHDQRHRQGVHGGAVNSCLQRRRTRNTVVHTKNGKFYWSNSLVSVSGKSRSTRQLINDLFYTINKTIQLKVNRQPHSLATRAYRQDENADPPNAGLGCCMAFVWARLPNDTLLSDEPRLANRLFCWAGGDAVGVPKPPPNVAPPPNTGGPPNVVAGSPNADACGDPKAVCNKQNPILAIHFLEFVLKYCTHLILAQHLLHCRTRELDRIPWTAA